MEDIFKKLQSEGKNSLDNIINWFKDSKIIDGAKETEEKTRKMFSDVKDTTNIQYSKFKEVVEQLAEEKKKDIQEYAANLAKEMPKFAETAKEAAANLAKEGSKLAESASVVATAAASAAKNAFNNIWK